MRSQVTTKRGDQGRTVTISGDEYSKSHPLLECCGDLDALRAETALYRLEVLRSGRDDAQELGAFLFWLLLLAAAANPIRSSSYFVNIIACHCGLRVIRRSCWYSRSSVHMASPWLNNTLVP